MTEQMLVLTNKRAGRAACLPDACTTHPDIEAAWRRRMIREAAYFRSQRRPPCPGKEVEDWLVAEQEVDEYLQNPPG